MPPLGYSPGQARMIRLMLQMTRNDPQRVRRSLLMAGLVESGLRNLPYGDRDSEGVLQQRPSTGWGPASESARQDIRQYLRSARGLVNEGFQGGPGRLAQAVQRSAFPDRYGAMRGEVNQILGAYGGAPGAQATPPTQASYWAYNPADISQANRKQAALSLLGLGGPISAALAKRVTEQVQPQRYNVEIPQIAGVPGGASPQAQMMMAIIRMAQRRGYHVAENPWVDTVDPVHAGQSARYGDYTGSGSPSMHYQRFANDPSTRFNERKIGRAVDISGGNLQKLLRQVIRRYGLPAFNEVIYDPWGSYFAGGAYSSQPYGGHGTHIHFAI